MSGLKRWGRSYVRISSLGREKLTFAIVEGGKVDFFLLKSDRAQHASGSRLSGATFNKLINIISSKNNKKHCSKIIMALFIFFSLFFQPEQYFSLTTNQPKQYFGLFFQRSGANNNSSKKTFLIHMLPQLTRIMMHQVV